MESVISRVDEGAILLRWLSAKFRYCDETRWKSYIESGALRINECCVEPGAILRRGDSVAFAPLDLVEPDVSTDYSILYEDADYLVIDKPALLPCHPGGRFFKNTLWYLLREKYDTLHFASRLDRETSGLMLACLSPRSIKHISGQQERGFVNKEYRVIVHGEFPAALSAHGFLTQDHDSVLRKKRKFVQAKPTDAGTEKYEYAETDFAFLRSIRHNGEALSLVSASLGTGRTHQIRATLLSFGYPVCGDKVYGRDESLFLRFAGGTLSEADDAQLMLPHQALQSFKLAFTAHDGRAFEFTAPQGISLLWPDENADILRGEPR